MTLKNSQPNSSAPPPGSFSTEKLLIKTMPEGYRYWLKALGDMQWPILPGSKNTIIQACQHSKDDPSILLNACQQDPLFCWQLSRRANTVTQDRDRWPSNLTQLIKALGEKQIQKIAQSAIELPSEKLQSHYCSLSRLILNNNIATALFTELCTATNPSWIESHGLACLLYKLPEWGIAILEPQIQLQLETLHVNGMKPSDAQKKTLNCQILEFSVPFAQQSPIHASCRDSWKVDVECLPQQTTSGTTTAAELLIACHHVCSNQWNKSEREENLSLLENISGVNREALQKRLSKIQLSMPWPQSLDKSLHPSRWQLCDWDIAQWLPSVQWHATKKAPVKTGIKLGPGSNTCIKKDAPRAQADPRLFSESLQRLMGRQPFASNGHLLEYCNRAMQMGLASQAGMILICSKGQLKCRHSFGLNFQTSRSQHTEAGQAAPTAALTFDNPQNTTNLLHKILLKAAAARVDADNSQLPPALRQLFLPSQQLALMSILLKGQPAAILLLAENHSISEQRYLQFKQLGQGFYHALLRQLSQAKPTPAAKP